MFNKKLEEILLEMGAVKAAQIQECLVDIGSSGKSVTSCLLEKQFLTQENLAKAYSQMLSLNYVESVTEKMADPEKLALVPLKFLRDNVIVPVVIDEELYILTSDPLDFQPVDELNLMLGGRAQVAVATRSVIIDSINRYYPLEGTKQMIEDLEEEKDLSGTLELSGVEEQDIMGMGVEAPIVKLVNSILFQAVKRDASDIHIEPEEKDVRVRYRIDGVMHQVFMPPKRAQAAITSRLKIMANLNIAEKRLPQDGRIQIRVGDKAIDLRVSVLPVAYGERIVMRLLDKTKTFRDLKDLGFTERDYSVVDRATSQPNGIVLVTGPTGSGKTSTLYSVLARLNSPKRNIITVEDPIEYQMKGISQVQVKDKIGLTFAAALRSILRQDPDIVMIGETRDHETAQIAIQASLTGHLVLSTLHTNNAPAAITRLIDMGIEPFLISSSLICVLAQRLVRVLCPKCKQEYHPTAELIHRLGISPERAKSIKFFEPKPEGCENCSGAGYKGRLAIFEVMEMTGEIARLTVERSDTAILRKQAMKDGMKLLIEDGLRRIEEGVTTIDEVLAVAVAQEGVEE
ncbi:MAG: General secretory pathway protein E [candidate division TM6 bacterium GW2011_GWF2_32_72]|nr:MAG: General secretory pathway protein E [candidate division TM6 bacterium GW2011_GWF2_32_72]